MNDDRPTLVDAKKSVLEFIVNRLPSLAQQGQRIEQVSLFSDGLLDSIVLLELIAHIEEFAKVKIPNEALLIENFDTIAGITGQLEECYGRGTEVGESS
ncbi:MULTISPECIES: acyl carrier protein [unclassified Bradyrhizobium]|uniref:acyl carrier protein n=1 Tax=unclassified Bradyrhizobium TaxID=2631580 RepID=UPI0029168465|nr:MULTISPECIES: acyl carrier protein [unclassified Bradyrhizobium]